MTQNDPLDPEVQQELWYKICALMMIQSNKSEVSIPHSMINNAPKNILLALANENNKLVVRIITQDQYEKETGVVEL